MSWRSFPRHFQLHRAAFLGLLLGLAASGPAARAQAFDPVRVYPTVAGTRPYGLAVGDVNGDGLLDIVAGDNNSTIHTATLLAGQPGGLFGPPVAYPAAAGSFGLRLGDVNQDGRLDLVTSYAGPFAVGVQLGQASGFGATVTYPTRGFITQKVALGDVNGDGWLDIVTANLASNSVSVLLGQTNGFAQAALYPTGANSEPFSVVLGDMNGDGRLDIVTSNIESATIGVLLGQAVGFAPVATYSAFRSAVGSTTHYFMDVALADVDGDNQLDVITTSADSISGPTVGVLLGQAGGLSPITYYGPAAIQAHGIAVGDVNLDGWPDIVLANPGTSAASVLVGFPGGFSNPIAYSTGPHSAPFEVVLADVNLDGRPDIVTTNSASSSVGVLLNATPQFRTVTNTAPSAGAAGNTITLNGSNLQGAVAVVFAGTGNRSVSSGFTVNAAGTQITGVVVPSGAASGRVRVVTPSSTVASSTVFTVLSPTATQTGRAANAMALYPNPAKAGATLALPAGASPRPVLVFDALGRLVQQATLPAQASNLVLDLSNLPAGMYAVRCGAATCRLVKE